MVTIVKFSFILILNTLLIFLYHKSLLTLRTYLAARFFYLYISYRYIFFFLLVWRGLRDGSKVPRVIS